MVLLEGQMDKQTVKLSEVTKFYEKNLYASNEIISFLEEKGFTDSNLIKHFSLGFCNNTLKDIISLEQRKAFKELWVIRKENGQEYFSGCLIVPIKDKQGTVQSLFGYSIKPNTRNLERFLDYENPLVFNESVLQTYANEIIIGESILETLQFFSRGIHNVISLIHMQSDYSPLITALEKERVKSVILSFSNKRLEQTLIESGFTVKQISCSPKENWDSFFTQSKSSELLKTKIEQAEIINLKTKGKEEPIQVLFENGKYEFTLSEIMYRVMGVKELFLTSLKVHIKASFLDLQSIDYVDLFSARSRQSFSRETGRLFGMEEKRIEKDLITILDYLEQKRDSQMDLEGSGTVEVTEPERKLAMKFLKSEDIIKSIIEDTAQLGYVGENRNKVLMYLSATSRKLDDPMSVIVLSQSASGKSYLIDTVKRLMPGEDVVSATSISDNSLYYLSENGLVHKFLVLGEAVHGERIDYQLREMLSSHELSRLVTVSDSKSGSLSSAMVRKKAIVSMVMSSTNYNLNSENMSRCFVISTDESQDQTRAIHRIQRKKYYQERFELNTESVQTIIKKHQAAQRLLEKKHITMPYAHILDFPSHIMRSRRDHERFIDLIASVCHLRQFQKEEKQVGDICFIECDLYDYRIAYDIMVGILPHTLQTFPTSAASLYKVVRSLLKEKAKQQGLLSTEVSITQREIREQSGLSQQFVKDNMRELVNYEYLQTEGITSRGMRKQYKLITDCDLNSLDLSMIPTPKELENKFSA
jgi:DNA primase